MPKCIASWIYLKQLELRFLWYREGDFFWCLSILNASSLLQNLILMFYGTVIEENQTVQMQNFSGNTNNQLKHVEMGACFSNCYDIELAKFLLKAATKLDRIVVDPCKRFYKGDGEYGLIGIRILLSVNCAEKCALDCSKMKYPSCWCSIHSSLTVLDLCIKLI